MLFFGRTGYFEIVKNGDFEIVVSFRSPNLSHLGQFYMLASMGVLI